jgi:hypothetical protein
MKTRKDFNAVAATIKKLPKAKREDAFFDCAAEFQTSNKRFDIERFAKACGVEYSTERYVYVPPPPEVLAEIPEGLNVIRTVKTDLEHCDVFLNDEKIGSTYKNYYTYDDASFYADRDSKYYTLIRHVNDGGYTGIYTLCLIFKAYHLNEDNTMSVDCTENYLGFIVIKPDGLTTSGEKNTVCEHEGCYDIYKNFKKVGVKMPKFGDYTAVDEGIFVYEQIGRFYNQIAFNHATVWFNRKDADKAARKVKGKVIHLLKWVKDHEVQRDYWPRWVKQRIEARQKEIATATERLNKGYC